ncbi:MAG: hypothetical protein E7536_04425 [Ruminococcaceae bacterium]|nr:hypothetical protein [Oscillospiraceae bacterium]
MESKELRKYFLSGSFSLCIFGIVATVISALWLIFRLSFDIGLTKIYLLEILLLCVGPILVFITLKNTIKTFSLLSKLKRNNLINNIYRSFSDTSSNIYYNQKEIIISDYYLFLKDVVDIIPHHQITQIYTEYITNDKKQITCVQLFCDTTQKKKIRIFQNIKNPDVLVHFAEKMRQKNPNIVFILK